MSSCRNPGSREDSQARMLDQRLATVNLLTVFKELMLLLNNYDIFFLLPLRILLMMMDDEAGRLYS